MTNLEVQILIFREQDIKVAKGTEEGGNESYSIQA
jgi:hypothetical protein